MVLIFLLLAQFIVLAVVLDSSLKVSAFLILAPLLVLEFLSLVYSVAFAGRK